jgi:hypothetical protein
MRLLLLGGVPGGGRDELGRPVLDEVPVQHAVPLLIRLRMRTSCAFN